MNDICKDCGQPVTDPEDTQDLCISCHEEYWSDYCELCGAEPEEECEEGCENAHKWKGSEHYEASIA